MIRRMTLVASIGIAALALMLVAGCGGGDDSSAASGPSTGPKVSSVWGDASKALNTTPEDIGRQKRLGIAVVPADSSPTLTYVEALFEWAERQFPQYFPTRSSTLSEGPWYYRSYFSTGVFLGVNAGDVYVLGGPFGNVPLRVGKISDFIARPNTTPVAVVGANQSVLVGTLVSLDGSSSLDADLDQITYSWTITDRPTGSVAALSSSTSPRPTFRADLGGMYVVALVVNDGKASSAPVTVTVTASAANAPPIASAGVPQNVGRGATVTLDGSASSDPNGDPLTFVWALTSRPSGSLASISNIAGVRPTFVADLAGTYVASLVVSDGKLNSAPATVVITAAAANSAPVANAGLAQSVTVGASVSLNGSGSSDADGDTLSYSWTFTSKPSGSIASISGSTSARPSFVADMVGSYVVTLIVGDGKISSSPVTVTVTATAVQPSGLSALYGRVTLSYHFAGSSTGYTDIVIYSAADIVGGETLVRKLITDGRFIACGVSSVNGFGYLCVAKYSSGSSDNYLFNLSNGVITGNWAFCTSTQTTSSCASKLISNGDGPLTGSVSPAGLDLAATTSSIDQSDWSTEASKHGLRAAQANAPLPEPPAGVAEALDVLAQSVRWRAASE